MSYDKNGRNTRQDILEEIERLERLRSAKDKEKRSLGDSRAFQKGLNNDRQKGSTEGTL